MTTGLPLHTSASCQSLTRLYHCTRVSKAPSIRPFFFHLPHLPFLPLLPQATTHFAHSSSFLLSSTTTTVNLLQYPLHQHHTSIPILLDQQAVLCLLVWPLHSRSQQHHNNTRTLTQQFNMTTLTTMASPARIPFASLGGGRLRNMTNIKNKQNGRWTR